MLTFRWSAPKSRVAALVAAAGTIVMPLVAPTVLPSADATAGVVLRVGSYNIRAGETTESMREGLNALLPRVDVVGLQEINSMDKQAVLDSASASGFAYYRNRPAGNQEPVLWRTSAFEKVSARVVKLTGSYFIGDEFPGRASVSPPKYVTVVHLRTRATHELVSIINVHLQPGAIRGGRPVRSRPRLVGFYKAQVAALEALTRVERLLTDKVMVLGDFNVGWVADSREQRRRLPYRSFQRESMPSMWATERPAAPVGTHSNALIDQVYSPQAALTATVQTDILHSDHLPAVATYLF